MKDIKSLYLTAKSSGKQHDVDDYMEAVNDLLENKPRGYISDLEYIISSNIGLATLKEFVERYGMSVASYSQIMTCIEESVKKCKQSGKDASPYLEAITMMESFKDKYRYNFILYEAFADQVRQSYVDYYYERKVPLIKNVNNLYSKFGLAIIPDVLIECVRDGTMDNLFTIFENSKLDPIAYQWILECTKDVTNLDSSLSQKISNLKERALEGIVLTTQLRNQQVLRESVLTGDDQIVFEYSPNEIKAMEDLISFKEYMLTCLESSDEIVDMQNQIYSLYENLGGLIDEDASIHDADIYQEFRGSEDAQAIKKIAENIKGIIKEAQTEIRQEIIQAVKDHNKDKGWFDSSRVMRPHVQVVPGNEDGPFATDWFMKGKVKKHLEDITDSSGELLNDFRLYVIFSTETGAPLRDNQKRAHIMLYYEAMEDALYDLIKEKKVSLEKEKNYTVWITTWNIPIYLYRSAVLEGVDRSMLESVGPLEEVIADSVVPMLPQSMLMSPALQKQQESWTTTNTINKKTGSVPDFIGKNHNLGYGEDDNSKKDEDLDPEDFKRPSASDSDSDSGDSDDKLQDLKDDIEDAKTPEEKKQAINNYYYYTYTNSFNKHKKDDHSVHTTHIDQSKKIDDHSINKRMHSDNIEKTECDDSFQEKKDLSKGKSPKEMKSKLKENDPALVKAIQDALKNDKDFKEFYDIVVESSSKISDVIPELKNLQKKFVLEKYKGEVDDEALESSSMNSLDVGLENLSEQEGIYENTYVKGALELSFLYLQTADDWILIGDSVLKKVLSVIEPFLQKISKCAFAKNIVARKSHGKSDYPELDKVLEKYKDIVYLNTSTSFVSFEIFLPIKYFLKDFESKTESAPWEINNNFFFNNWTSEMLLTEMPLLPEEYHEMYAETMSTLLTEANALVLDPRVAGGKSLSADDSVKTGLWEKIKAMAMKFFNFLLELWDKIFPKTILSFSRLAKKYHKSEKMMKFCREKQYLIPLLQNPVEIHIGSVSTVLRAFIEFINDGTLPKVPAEEYKAPGIAKIMPFFGSYKNPEDVTNDDRTLFCIASNYPRHNDSPGLGGNRLRWSTFLSEDTLLEAFGIRIAKGADGVDIWGYPEFRMLLRGMRAGVWATRYADKRFRDNPTGYKNLISVMKYLTEVTNFLNKIMNESYRRAVELLRTIEADPGSGPIKVESSQERLHLESGDKDDATNSDKPTAGEADDDKPTSDNPIRDFGIELDKKMTAGQQAAKRKVQDVVNVGRVFMKPAKRTSQWISNMVGQWKSKDETAIKEKLADPHARSGLLKAIRAAIVGGSLFKAHLLFNPIFMGLALLRRKDLKGKEVRLRNEMMGELKAEVEIIEEKIKQADSAGDHKAKYQLMRLKNELNKKILRVGGGKRVAKVL